MTSEDPLFCVELNPKAGVEETPEVRAWLAKVSAVLNAELPRSRWEEFKTNLAVYGVASIKWPNGTNEVYGRG